MLDSCSSVAVLDFNDLDRFPLSREARAEVLLLEEIMVRIASKERGERSRVIQQINCEMGHLRGFDTKSLYRKFKAWNESGRSRAALVNRAMQKRLVSRSGVYHCYKTYCEKNQRGSRAAWREMMADLAAGKILPHGVGSWHAVFRAEYGESAELPARCPYDESHPPEGWTYGRLQQACGLSPYEKTSARVGTSAARDFILPVHTTRVGLHAGQYYQFDDKWHDVEVNFEGQPRGIRPLEFACYDVFSARKVAYGLRPRLLNEETGKHENLNEREMRFLVAHLLTEVGFHKDGCTLMTEHGTAAVRKNMQERLARLTQGLVRVERSGIMGDQVHAGMWPGKGGGNYKFKALTESLHGLDHNALAALPAQTGKDRNNRPEQFHGLSVYNADLIKAMAQLPEERRSLLLSPLLNFTQYANLVGEIYERLEDRKWHTLEGWEQLEFIVPYFCLGDRSNWFPMSSLDSMPKDQQAAIRAFLSCNPSFMETRRLSPRQVWAAGTKDLIRVPSHMLPDILEWDDGFTVRTELNGTMQFEDRYLGPGVHIFHATVISPAGYQQALAPGREYQVHITPYATDKLFVSDVESRTILGVAPRYDRAPRYDADAVHRLQGAQAHHRATLSADIKGRHQSEAESRAALIAHNAAVISGSPVTGNERAAAKSADQIDIAEELRMERELLEKQGE